MPGAIAITALLFTAVHVPDDAWRFADVLASSVLLGVARARTGSSLTMMLAHVLGNLKVLVVIALTT
jgi:membrane protease YdiL (CAAX protease family)